MLKKSGAACSCRLEIRKLSPKRLRTSVPTLSERPEWGNEIVFFATRTTTSNATRTISTRFLRDSSSAILELFGITLSGPQEQFEPVGKGRIEPDWPPSVA